MPNAINAAAANTSQPIEPIPSTSTPKMTDRIEVKNTPAGNIMTSNKTSLKPTPSSFWQKIKTNLTKPTVAQPPVASRAEKIEKMQAYLIKATEKRESDGIIIDFLERKIRNKYSITEILTEDFINKNPKVIKNIIQATGDKILGILTLDTQAKNLLLNVIHPLYFGNIASEIAGDSSYLSLKMVNAMSSRFAVRRENADKKTFDLQLLNYKDEWQDTIRSHFSAVDKQSFPAPSGPYEARLDDIFRLCFAIQKEVCNTHYSASSDLQSIPFIFNKIHEVMYLVNIEISTIAADNSVHDKAENLIQNGVHSMKDLAAALGFLYNRIKQLFIKVADQAERKKISDITFVSKEGYITRLTDAHSEYFFDLAKKTGIDSSIRSHIKLTEEQLSIFTGLMQNR